MTTEKKHYSLYKDYYLPQAFLYYVETACGLQLSVGGTSLGHIRKAADVRKSYEQGPWLASG